MIPEKLSNNEKKKEKKNGNGAHKKRSEKYFTSLLGDNFRQLR